MSARVPRLIGVFFSRRAAIMAVENHIIEEIQ
jgi:hypothetical protein